MVGDLLNLPGVKSYVKNLKQYLFLRLMGIKGQHVQKMPSAPSLGGNKHTFIGHPTCLAV